MSNDRSGWLLFLLAVVIVVGGCDSTVMQPVEFYPEDMCSTCKMAISDKRFAGELVSSEGTVQKFDDLGCMFRQLSKAPDAGRTVSGFVVDFEDRGWVGMTEARYLRSEMVKTPMRSGLVAFRDASEAEAAGAKYGGQVLSYAEITSKGE